MKRRGRKNNREEELRKECRERRGRCMISVGVIL